MPRRFRVLSAAAGMGALGLATLGLAAGPATGAAPGPLCTPGATAAKGGVIAGYTMTALAAGFRYQVNSPGLLPIGDAQVGTIDETDVPFARTTVDSGPVIDALGAPAYPGDTLARFGSVLGQFGAPGVPNPPIVAESNYPASPTYGESATFNKAPAPGAAALSASSTATATAATADATSAAVGLAQVPGGSAPVSGGSSDTSTGAHIGTGCVDSTAHVDTGAITIAGLIQIQGVTGDASARSDGGTGVPTATLKVGHVTVGGLEAFIDNTGVHLAGQPSVGGAVADTVNNTLQKTLSAGGLSVRVISPTANKNGALAVADSGGLVVTVTHQLPAVPALQIPPIPLVVVVEYGEASAAAAATVAPAPGSPPPPAASGGSSAAPSAPAFTGSSPASSGTGGEAFSAPGLSGSTPTGGSAPVVSGSGPSSSETFSASPAAATPAMGRSVPIGWVLVGLLGVLTLMAPMLGYARWQLLEGRI